MANKQMSPAYGATTRAPLPRVLFEPLSTLVRVIRGIMASLIFNQFWKHITHEGKAPTATQKGRTWRELLVAAASQGAILGLVKAAVDSGGATGFERATGAWPGDPEPSPN
jgi:hypothetical protein